LPRVGEPESADTPERRLVEPVPGCNNKPMIQLTRLNSQPLALNSDLIKFVEQAPDTVITLITGEKVVVREKAQEVLNRVVQFRRAVLQGAMLWWDNRSALIPVTEDEDRTAGEK
jgi:flagellar protein FlbD